MKIQAESHRAGFLAAQCLHVCMSSCLSEKFQRRHDAKVPLIGILNAVVRQRMRLALPEVGLKADQGLDENGSSMIDVTNDADRVSSAGLH
jgi:hypothetical protein